MITLATRSTLSSSLVGISICEESIPSSSKVTYFFGLSGKNQNVSNPRVSVSTPPSIDIPFVSQEEKVVFEQEAGTSYMVFLFDIRNNK